MNTLDLHKYTNGEIPHLVELETRVFAKKGKMRAKSLLYHRDNQLLQKKPIISAVDAVLARYRYQTDRKCWTQENAASY